MPHIIWFTNCFADESPRYYRKSSYLKTLRGTRRGNEILLSFARVRTYENRKRRNLFYHIHTPRMVAAYQADTRI